MPDGTTRYYYVDETGDGTIFNARGHVIIGSEGVSRYFMLGLLDVADPAALEREMDFLHTIHRDLPSGTKRVEFNRVNGGGTKL